MSTSLHVMGFKPPDEKWRQHKAIWDACARANVHPPRETLEFFDENIPDPAGVVVDLKNCGAAKTYFGTECSGYEVDITKLPKDVTVIRFVNSW
jgi:hypothetical protein